MADNRIRLSISRKNKERRGIHFDHYEPACKYEHSLFGDQNVLTVSWTGPEINKVVHISIATEDKPSYKPLIGDRVQFGKDEGLDIPSWALGQKGIVTNILSIKGEPMYQVVLDNGNVIVEEAYQLDRIEY